MDKDDHLILPIQTPNSSREGLGEVWEKGKKSSGRISNRPQEALVALAGPGDPGSQGQKGIPTSLLFCLIVLLGKLLELGSLPGQPDWNFEKDRDEDREEGESVDNRTHSTPWKLPACRPRSPARVGVEWSGVGWLEPEDVCVGARATEGPPTPEKVEGRKEGRKAVMSEGKVKRQVTGSGEGER